MRKILAFLLVVVLITLHSCSSGNNESIVTPVIIETDMGNDVDDALAVALAYCGDKEGKIDLRMVSNHKMSKTAPEFIDIINTWYGFDKTIVANSSTPVMNNQYTDYTDAVVNKKDSLGMPAYKRSGKYVGGYSDPVDSYRKILSESDDNSVVIVSLGFSTTLAQLLDSKEDKYSSLSGRDLIAKKVKYLSLMAGSYGKEDTLMVNGKRETLFDKTKKRCEFNVANDIPALDKVLKDWPVRIYQIPFEIGPMVMYPKTVVADRVGPVFDAYRAYRKKPFDRPTWDLLAVAYVLDPQLFNQSEAGTVTIDENGFNHFYPASDTSIRKVNDHNAHYVITITPEQADVLKDYLIDKTTCLN